jgi:SpoVK/Ycf46/Vps4 family AAA+-type ATPase
MTDFEREVPKPTARLHALQGSDADEPSLKLDDVAGMEEVKQRLRISFLGPAENPALRRMYGKSLRGGLLLWGPPGCGKTFIARATAGEIGARFISVGLHDVLDMYLGESERKLHDLFEEARRNAPSILFFDEIDALGHKRTQLRHTGGRNIVAQFLSELDGFHERDEGVYVFATTNQPWDVDSALRRPGRLDRMVLVLPPDQEARAGILDFHLRGRPVGDVDVLRIAEKTDLYSGADLAHVCESAAEFALEDSLATGTPRPISTEDLERALRDVRPSTVAWLQLARNYVQFSSEGGAFSELLEYLQTREL